MLMLGVTEDHLVTKNLEILIKQLFFNLNFDLAKHQAFAETSGISGNSSFQFKTSTCYVHIHLGPRKTIRVLLSRLFLDSLKPIWLFVKQPILLI